MCLSVFEFKEYVVKEKIITPIATGTIFVVLSVLIYKVDIQHGLVSFLLGLIACFSVVVFIAKIYADKKQSVVFGILAKYTMPIFVMHTLFAASLRTMLFGIGIQNAAIHVVLGIVISFVGPIIAALVMKKIKWLEFVLYPGKFLRI